ncbi:MAG: hypothetical protein KJ914_02615 [Gammaproteobacteria bacterium]|nr:hypothetical protein [Gammaproteobacteria bacterium]MBU1722614.1 hypothetical protein [Gammaproteobacteria bacterium]MBU2007086.1 hypothetical protein [Gammaproteobacteria bacterium]
MSEIEQTPAAQPANLQARALEIFQKLLPLVDSVADKLRFALMLGIGLVGWIFVWLFFLKGFSLNTALIVAGVALLPLLVILRFWWALEELKGLPEIVGGMVGDAKQEFQTTVQGIRAGDRQKVGLLGSVGKLWTLGSLAGEARELLGSYISIGTLANPFSLILGVLALLFVLLLVLVGVVLLFLAFF